MRKNRFVAYGGRVGLTSSEQFQQSFLTCKPIAGLDPTAMAQRVAAALNAVEGIPTEHIEEAIATMQARCLEQDIARVYPPEFYPDGFTHAMKIVGGK